MIAGVGQVVVNVADIDAALSTLLDRGYTESFRVSGVPNHPAKVPFQRCFRRELKLVHLKHPTQMAIELTSYSGEPPTGRAAYSKELDDSCSSSVELAVEDPERSAHFWRQGFGFSTREKNYGYVLQSPSILPSWRLNLSLKSSLVSEGAVLDAAGMVLVTVLTSSIDKQLRQLANTNLLLRSTEVWQEQFGQFAPRVALVEGPGGELIELLEAHHRGEVRDEG